MDFTNFNNLRFSELWHPVAEELPEEIRDYAKSEYRSVEEWKAQYIKTVSTEDRNPRRHL